ncbi:MAG TPA: peptidylprolyl isomerase [Candidatus Limnocylindrales bacterium]|nr:peptidylprolyl isomerase [Candidatus Limnocylindrales bacterium]
MSLRSMILLLAVAASLAFLGANASAGPSDSTAPAGTSDSTAVQPPSDSGESAQADSVKAAGKAADEAAERAAKAEKDAKDAREHAAKKAKKKAKAASSGKGTKMAGTMPVKPDVLPQHVQVQHILIGFTGSVPGKSISRTKEEAKTLAYQILERARKGEDFDELVRKYTDDSPPGIYGMSGAGVAPATGEFPRGGMVPAFGNVGFSISPGNIGIADYDATASPFGWHVIKRLK